MRLSLPCKQFAVGFNILRSLNTGQGRHFLLPLCWPYIFLALYWLFLGFFLMFSARFLIVTFCEGKINLENGMKCLCDIIKQIGKVGVYSLACPSVLEHP